MKFNKCMELLKKRVKELKERSVCTFQERKKLDFLR